jgi:hypothetical protein
MTTEKQARNSRFQQGSGVFECQCCHRPARDTGDNGQLKLCSQCFEIAGYENTLSDHGELQPSEAAHVREQFNQLTQLLGSASKARDTAEELYDYVFIKMPQVEVPKKVRKSKAKPASVVQPSAATEETTVTEAEEPGLYNYMVHCSSPDGKFAELLFLQAPNSKTARRIAAAEAKRLNFGPDLTFNAERIEE